jgi:hypothetical protein
MNLCEPYRILNFNSKDYPYVPRCDAKSNRSRIDFFLVSENLINISRCEIADKLQSKLFDHKAIFLDLNNRKKKMVVRQFICNEVLLSDVIDIVVHVSVAESYVQHLEIRNRQDLLNTIGQIRVLILNAGLNFKDRPGSLVTAEEVEAREGIVNRARYLLQFLNVSVFENANLTCEDDFFMETLVNNVRNDVCSFQSFFLKEQKKTLMKVL